MRLLFAILVITLVSACAATPGKISVTKPITTWDAETGLGLEGYDPVAYFKEQTPVQGRAEYNQVHQGVTWRFASAEHQAAFAAAPDRYLPQYGGYCAFAISRGTVAHGDPHQWAVVDDKLYVNNNAFAMSLWNQDRPGNIAAADENWPLYSKVPIE